MLDEPPPWEKLSVWRFATYGTVFTVGLDLLIYPLQTLTTRIQVETRSRATFFESVWRTLCETLRADSGRGLFRGFLLFTFGGLPSQGAYFIGYNWCKDRLSRVDTVPSAAVPMIAGFFADAIAAPLWLPFEVVTSRLQIQGPGVVRHDSAAHVVRHVLRTDGVRGLFRGLGMQVAAFGPASALWWASYEAAGASLRQAARSRFARADTPVASKVDTPLSSSVDSTIHATAGLIAGLLTSVVTNPLDIAKTRLQTQSSVLREYGEDAVARTDAAVRRERLEREAAHRAARRNAFFVHIRDNREHQQRIASATSTAHANNAWRPAPQRDIIHPATQERPHLLDPSLRDVRSSAATGGHLDRGRRSRRAMVVVQDAAASHSARVAPRVYPSLLGFVPYASSIASNPLAVAEAANPAKEAIRAAAATLPGRRQRPRSPVGTPRDLRAAAAALQARIRDANAAALAAFYPRGASAAATSSGVSVGAAPTRLHTSFASVLTSIVRDEGAAALMRGLLPRMLVNGPASAATFVLYEQVIRLSTIDTPSVGK